MAKSIADASPSEREIGIRAAFAAQKLREWRNEISQWQWPSRKECGQGAGFLPPQKQIDVEENGSKSTHIGCLPLRLVDQYEQRIDEIRDAMESLEMDEIKDHVLAAHSNSNGDTQVPVRESRLGLRSSSYGRMRDFTALITATVIQALPDLAILTSLLATWDVRLNVLRQLPMLLEVMEGTRRGVRAACLSTTDHIEASRLNQKDFEDTRELLGGRVSDLGGRIDKLLDLLEDQDDALPQHWIDALENIELEYARWVVDTQRVVTQHKQREEREQQAHRDAAVELPASPVLSNATAVELPSNMPHRSSSLLSAAALMTLPEATRSNEATIDHQQLAEARAKLPPPPLYLDTPSHRGHRRETSEVSIADSAYSAMSGISEAEIVEARQTQVLPSPKISMVDNPYSPMKADMGFFNSNHEAAHRPPMVQRASTASFEVIPKEQLKRVDLRKSMSADLLSRMTQPRSPESTPSKALRQLSGETSAGPTPLAELHDPMSLSPMPDQSVASSCPPIPFSDGATSTLSDKSRPFRLCRLTSISKFTCSA